MSLEAIHAAIPHRAPFLFLDAIVEQSPERIRCRKRFTADEWFFVGHYPQTPIVPGVILCEAAMQAGAVLLSSRVPPGTVGVPVATRIGDVRFKQLVRPGDEIELDVELVERLSNAFYLKARVERGTQTVARLEFACTLASGG